MTTKQHEGWERRLRLVTEIEEAMFAADDEAVLVAPGMPAAARDARAVISDAARLARSRMAVPLREPRRSVRQLPRRAAPRRAMMRELLVANPRARDMVGKSLDAMTDAEIEAALTRLAASGILPEQEG